LFKKTLFLMFSFFILLSTVGNSVLTVYAADDGKTAITSSKYGTQMNKTLSFNQKACSDEYKRLNAQVSEIKEKNYDFGDDDEGLSGVMGKIADWLNKGTIFIGNLLSKMIFGAACYLGFAPSQLLQIMFFPVVLDNFLFLDTLSSAVRTISILVLGIVTVLSIYELNKKEGTIGEELVSKIGKFLVAGGLIAFSGFILQGIFDIANVLGYYVSHYQVNINVNDDITDKIEGGKKLGEISVNLLNFPTIFLIYLEFAFSPKILNEIPGFSINMLGFMTIIKLIVLFFMIKDLLQIAIYGLKRLVTLVASAILMPILAGLIPSYKTQDIFNRYFRSLIGAAFTPVLFGIIYLASAPFIIDDMVNMIDAPILKIITIGFYLNILVSIPAYVDELVGSSNTLGNQGFERGVQRMNMGRMISGAGQSFALGTYKNYTAARDNPKAKSISVARAAGRSIKGNVKDKATSMVYGQGFGKHQDKLDARKEKANHVQKVRVVPNNPKNNSNNGK